MVFAWWLRYVPSAKVPMRNTYFVNKRVSIRRESSLLTAQPAKPPATPGPPNIIPTLLILQLTLGCSGFLISWIERRVTSRPRAMDRGLTGSIAVFKSCRRVCHVFAFEDVLEGRRQGYLRPLQCRNLRARGRVLFGSRIARTSGLYIRTMYIRTPRDGVRPIRTSLAVAVAGTLPLSASISATRCFQVGPL